MAPQESNRGASLGAGRSSRLEARRYADGNDAGRDAAANFCRVPWTACVLGLDRFCPPSLMPRPGLHRCKDRGTPCPDRIRVTAVAVAMMVDLLFGAGGIGPALTFAQPGAPGPSQPATGIYVRRGGGYVWVPLDPSGSPQVPGTTSAGPSAPSAPPAPGAPPAPPSGSWGFLRADVEPGDARLYHRRAGSGIGESVRGATAVRRPHAGAAPGRSEDAGLQAGHGSWWKSPRPRRICCIFSLPLIRMARPRRPAEARATA